MAGAFAPKPEATEAGGTLAGDDGKDVADKAADNASKAPAADKEKVVEADAVADGTARAEDKGADAEKPSTGSDSSPSKSDSKPSSGSTNKPNHEHEWQVRTALNRYTPPKPIPLSTRRRGTNRFVAVAISCSRTATFAMTV